MRRAFTLLELLVVLALLGATAALVAPRLAQGAASARTRAALGGVVHALRAERAEAVRALVPRDVTLRRDDAGGLRLVATGEPEMVWPGFPLVLLDGDSAGVPALEAHFEASGRARGGPWAFGEPAGGAVWVIGFDPVSGAPGLLVSGRGLARSEDGGER